MLEHNSFHWWPIETYGTIKAPSGAKGWYDRFGYLPVFGYSAERIDTITWNKFVSDCKEMNENTRYRRDTPKKDFWGNEGIRRVWTVSGWKSIIEGDCDDSATMKLRHALNLGFSRGHLKLCYCKKLTAGNFASHLVLLAIDPFNRVYVFDNVTHPFNHMFPFTMDNPIFDFIAMEGYDYFTPTEWLRIKKKPNLLDVIKRVK